MCIFYILHTLSTLTKMWGLLISFRAWHLEHPSSSSNNSQKVFLHSSVPGTPFPRQKCLGGNVPRVRHWQHQDCQGRNPGGSSRNVSWGTYYTPHLGMTVTVRPQFHGSWGLYDFLKKKWSFWRKFHPLSPEPKSSACFLDNSKSRTRSFNSPWVNRW